MHPVLPLLAVAASLSVLRCQEIRVFGELVQQGGALRLATPDLVLLPGTTSLANEVGHFVEVRGTLVGGTLPALAATFAARTDHTFELNGGLRIGQTSTLRVDSPTAINYYLVASFAPGFVPLTGLSFVSGTVFVAVPTATIHAGPISSSWQEPLTIPNVAGLLGLEVWFQAAIFDGTFVYLNAQHAVVTT